MKTRKYLIINADDFGMSHEFNSAINELLLNNCISSASIMANGLAFDEAVNLVKKNNLKNIGLHLTLTRDDFKTESPLLYQSVSGGSSLLDEYGRLYTSAKLLKENADYEDIVREIAAQIETAKNAGIDITHIDNHMYSLMPRMGYTGYHAFFSAYRGKKHGFCGARIARNYYATEGLNYIWAGRKIAPYLRLKMWQLNIKGLDYSFAFPYFAEKYKTIDSKRKLLDSFLKQVRDGVTELHIHPCVFSNALKEYNPYWENRVQEFELFHEYNAIRLRKEYDIELIGYEELWKNGCCL